MNQGNNHIGCDVTECKYHAQTVNNCTLDHIEVKKHTPNATSVESTDCASFEMK